MVWSPAEPAKTSRASQRGNAGDLAAPHRQDAATSPLARALVATVAHDAAWPTRLADLLTPDRTILA